MPRYLVIALQAANVMDQTYLAGLPDVQNPSLARQARMAQPEEVAYQSTPNVPAYGAPDAGSDTDYTPDYGYTAGHGAFGWYTDHPQPQGSIHRRKRQLSHVQMADDFVRPSRFAEDARRRIQEEENLDTAADAAYGAAVSRYLNTFTTNNHHLSFSLILSLWAGSRSRCTEAPARARDMRCSPPGVITILSLLASQYIIDLINSSKNVNKCIYFISVLSQPRPLLRARAMRCSPPGDITTLSPWRRANIIEIFCR